MAATSCLASEDQYHSSYKNIFILAGQSNMVGRGTLTELVSERQPDPMILRFAKNGTWEMVADPLHVDIDVAPRKHAGVGPGMPFSKTLLQRKPDFGMIGLIPCAIGDNSMDQWSKGSPFPLYNDKIQRAQAALQSGGRVIQALLWYQGESDAASVESGKVYKTKFQKFIEDVRSDLQMPLLSVFEVALNNATWGPSLELVRAAQLDTANEVQNVECIDAIGFETVNWDHLHLSTASQVKLGALMADAFIPLLD